MGPLGALRGSRECEIQGDRILTCLAACPGTARVKVSTRTRDTAPQGQGTKLQSTWCPGTYMALNGAWNRRGLDYLIDLVNFHRNSSKIRIFYMGIELELLSMDLEYIRWTSMPLISCPTAYYWTSMSIISQATAYYWTLRSICFARNSIYGPQGS